MFVIAVRKIELCSLFSEIGDVMTGALQCPRTFPFRNIHTHTCSQTVPSSSTPSRKCQIQLWSGYGEIVPYTAQESLFGLPRRQSNIVAMSNKCCHTTDFIQTQLLSDAREAACSMVSIHTDVSRPWSLTHRLRTEYWVWHPSQALVLWSSARE